MKTSPAISVLALRGMKKLAVQRDSVFALENHLFWRDQQGRGKVSGESLLLQSFRGRSR